ncbi:MAG: CoA pyrophosphatase [Gammaproteobacteria bacterium]|nr:CoA pyrophosphatase [Gammaproteobacteria bacterium]MCP5199843.1 CoA pyrophosphatase [Gammaproteobacteria bacterium]
MHCDDGFRELICGRLAEFSVQGAEVAGARAAAVAVTIVDAGLGAGCNGLPAHDDWQGGAALLLTRRSSRLRNHAGQWAFPGGRIDPGETPEDTALREMHEEIGLELGPERILGRLDDFVTRSGFIMTPVVIWGGPQRDFRLNPDEVDSVHRIPVPELLREDAPLLDHVADDAPPVLRMPIGDDWIAAPTAAILYQFREVCVLGRDTRVAHYDQPRFAWR